MDGIILNSILSGTRIQQVTEGVKMGVSSSTDLVTATSFQPANTIKPNLLVAEKVNAYNVYVVKTNVGLLASSVSVSYDPIYSILNRHIIGTRVGHDGANSIYPMVEFADQVHKMNTGISTYGIGYTPVISEETTKSELRRWPRNWFGDNIKN